jgi:hypothetical protein
MKKIATFLRQLLGLPSYVWKARIVQDRDGDKHDRWEADLVLAYPPVKGQNFDMFTVEEIEYRIGHPHRVWFFPTKAIDAVLIERGFRKVK